MKERGHLIEAPEPPESNFLKSLFSKKAEWLYCPAESNVLAARRRTIKDTMRARSRCVATWTPAGRLVCGEQIPPKQSAPAGAAPSPPHQRQRVPMTRSEVTEQRLIEEAQRGPQVKHMMDLESQEFFQKRQQKLQKQVPLRSRASSNSLDSSNSTSTRHSQMIISD